MSSGPTPQASTPRPSAPPPQKSNALLWILAIIGGGVILMVVLGLVVAGVFVRRVRVDEAGKKVEIETAAGSIRVDSESAHRTGLPVYPGATRKTSEGAAVELSSRSGDAVGVTVESYSTTDNFDKVTEWYAQKLGPNFRREDGHGHVHGIQGVSDADVAFVEDRGAGARVVALQKKSGIVEISLVRAGAKEVQ